ncbi:MAG: CsgG/HfaB family protein [Saccharofermentanaceae bacterium]|jgi:hypothetical protein|nr:hypothetical protein [Bacteroidales bacterium]
MKKYLHLTIFALLTSAFSFAQDIECFVLAPPEIILENVTKISILDFSGEKGKALSEQMVSELFKESRGIKDLGGGLFQSTREGKTYQRGGRTNIFTVVERTQLEKVLQEQNLSNTGIVDDAQAATIGKVLGIDAIIMGSVTYTSKDEPSQSQLVDLTGKSYTQYCLKRTVTADARMKIIDVNTGKIIGTKDKRSTYTETKCDEKRSGLTSVSAMADLCVKDLAFELVNYFNPHFIYTKYQFEKIKNKDFKDKAKEAKEYIANGKLANAFPIFKAIYDADPYNASAAKNLGCLYDIVGNYDKAKEYYSIAAEIDPNTYEADVQRVEKEIAYNQVLTSIGVIIEKQDYAERSDVLADKVKTRGSKNDRYEVKKEADTGSETVVKVPGDTEFMVIEKKGNWILIKLLGGKQGYISKDFIK